MVILESAIGNYIQLKNIRYSFFGGNNYLGLANRPEVKKDVIHAIKKYGLNFSASRLTTGTSELHLQLEKKISEFKDRDDAVIFASGYMGNRILLHALREQYSALFIDEASHASIMDGIPSGLKNVFLYRHCSSDDLEILLEKNKKFKPLIITDGIFPLTGEIAPLDKIYELAVNYHALIVVDDAHATGILGENGRGTPEYFHLDKVHNLYQTETMSKALGSYGGFISAGKEIIKCIRDTSDAYQASTSLPPPLAAAGCSSLNIIMNQPWLRSKAIDNANKIRAGITKMGFQSSHDATPIIPVLFDLQKDALNLSEYLKKNHIIVPFINYPGKRNKFILRITASSLHKPGQIEELLNVIHKWKKTHEINKN